MKSDYREHLLRNNNIVIIMYGYTLVDGKVCGSIGVREEFDMAKRMGKYIIPIGSTGYEADSILQHVKTI